QVCQAGVDAAGTCETGLIRCSVAVLSPPIRSRNRISSAAIASTTQNQIRALLRLWTTSMSATASSPVGPIRPSARGATGVLDDVALALHVEPLLADVGLDVLRLRLDVLRDDDLLLHDGPLLDDHVLFDDRHAQFAFVDPPGGPLFAAHRMALDAHALDLPLDRLRDVFRLDVLADDDLAGLLLARADPELLFRAGQPFRLAAIVRL